MTVFVFERVARPAARLSAVVLVSALVGCALVDKPLRPTVYDFGPGAVSEAAATAPAATVAPIVLPEIAVGSALDSTAVLYRLAYDDPQLLLPYAQARWSMTPAQLLRLRLRQALVRNGMLLAPAEGQAASLSGPSLAVHLELDEFSQIFDTPTTSAGVLRLQVTAVRSTAASDQVIGQRSFAMQRPAATADARGGVRAMTAAADAAVEDIARWLATLR